ncbi:MAG: hypothetical protein AM1032_000016 [Mycoplasmataceae bacterium]|nr:MAG: hypothetical protein AM1032_000016 [Mycoplasmataceae bacterium]
MINKPTILKLECLNNELIAILSDGRKISIPFNCLTNEVIKTFKLNN